MCQRSSAELWISIDAFDGSARIVSERPHEYVALEALALPERGKVLHLREFGFVTGFRTVDKNNAVRHYVQYDPQKNRMKVAQGFFRHAHRQHWGIECYHRALKQLCHAERFFVRWKHAIRNHVFCALWASCTWSSSAQAV